MKISAVRSLQYLTSKIHPPLSLNPGDSQKLLVLLTTSFRAHLDREHGKSSVSKISAADVHLQSLLDNPLFSVSTQSKLNSKPGGMYKYRAASALRDVQNFKGNTVESFRQHVGAGTASIDLAKLCIEDYLKSFRGVNSERLSSKLSSDVSIAILQWLWSSGLEDSLEFLKDSKFVTLITPVLLVDGRDRIVHNWLSRLRLQLQTVQLNTLEDAHVRDNLHVQSNIVYSMTASEFKYGSGLNGALGGFLENVDSASKWVGTSKDLRQAHPSVFDARRVLHRAGSYLIHRFTHLPATSLIDSKNFERLFGSAESWSRNASLARAQLALLHPVSPDPSLSLQYIHKDMRVVNQYYGHRQNLRAVNLCLSTSRMLLSQGHNADAEWVLNFVQKSFPREIGNLDQDLRTASAEQKRESAILKVESGLRQLEAMALT